MEKELMMMQQVILEITQSGKSIDEAYQNIFNQLRRQIHTEIQGLLIEMHVTSCVLLKCDEEKTIKKFLFFFMPVEHQKFTITARIKAEVNTLCEQE